MQVVPITIVQSVLYFISYDFAIYDIIRSTT